MKYNISGAIPKRAIPLQGWTKWSIPGGSPLVVFVFSQYIVYDEAITQEFKDEAITKEFKDEAITKEFDDEVITKEFDDKILS